MENEGLLMWLVGVLFAALGAQTAVMIGFFHYRQKISTRLSKILGRLSAIQDMFGRVMGWLGRPFGKSVRGDRGRDGKGAENSAGEAQGEASPPHPSG